MSRRFRNTETGDTMNIPQRGGQYMHANSFCINCHGVNKHYPECVKPESYSIPTSAEVPSKNSSKRKWEIFKKQFVYPIPVGYWFTGTSLWECINLIKNKK
jgi:hypothetical protein